jgi:hypothetical protein
MLIMHTKLDRFIDRATNVLGWVLLVALALIVASGFYAITALPGASAVAEWWK